VEEEDIPLTSTPSSSIGSEKLEEENPI